MLAVIYVFITVSILFAISTLGYVVYDKVIEERDHKLVAMAKAPLLEELSHENVEVEEEETEMIIPSVDSIDAIEADELLSDTTAMKSVEKEKGAGHGNKGTVNIGDIDKAFESGDVVTIELLKEKELLHKNVGRVKILADGILTKPLTVKAESFSVQAIKMIKLTGGNVIVLDD